MAKVKKNKEEIYTIGLILVATLIGGSLIAGYLIGKNYETFGNKSASRNATILGAASTLIFLILTFIITNQAPGGFQIIIPLSYLQGVALIVYRYQRNKINDYLAKGYKKAPFFDTIMSGVISLVLSVAAGYIVFFLLSLIF